MISAAQLRAARGLLDWTRAELAKAASVSPETIKNIEHGTFRPQDSTEAAIMKAFSAHDVEFLENSGVRINKSLVKTFIGRDGYIEFLEDIIKTMQDEGGRTCQFNYSDKIISTYGETHVSRYNESMLAIKDLDAKCLVPYGDKFFPVKHCDYRWLKKSHSHEIPYYLYSNKIAILTSAPEQELHWVVINSQSLVQAYIKQFDMYWDEAEVTLKSKVSAGDEES